MAVRNPRSTKKPCSNCPQPKSESFTPPDNVQPPIPTSPTLGTQVKMVFSVPEQEGLRLWKHVLFGTTTCAKIIAGYALQAMPGDPREGIRSIIEILNQALVDLDARFSSETSNEVSPPKEQ
jgi:hypothetical protein